jgi:xanthine dehydrogenase YagT iron-sulfur-binding subunit
LLVILLAVMHDHRSPLAQALEPFAIAGSRDQPLVIAFAASCSLQESPELASIRAELRGLGAALLLVAKGRIFTFRPDDELDLNGRSDGYDQETSNALRAACGLAPTATHPHELALVVTSGDGRIVARQIVQAEDSLVALATGLHAAGLDAIARPRSARLSRREIVLASLVGAFALLAAPGCREPAKPPPIAAVSSAKPARTRQIALNINGQMHSLEIEPRVSLLDALRERLALTGSKKGCDHGQCGACTVLINGRRVNACLTLAVMVGDAPITTIEGLAKGDSLHPMQAAFVSEDALQCGYCTPGQIISAIGLVRENRAHTDAEVREHMSGNLCRCGAYTNIVAAIQKARAEISAG